MRSGSKQKQFQLLFLNAIDEEPIWFYMAFSEPAVVSSKTVIAMLFVEVLSRR